MTQLKDRKMIPKAFLTHKSTMHVSIQTLFFQKTRTKVYQISKIRNNTT